MTKTLVFVRHGHRDNSRRELDNGLSEKGREQAEYIRRFFTSRFGADDLASGLWLVSSPKIRCAETLQPLAKALDRQVDIHPALDEQGHGESFPAFEKRVEAFLEEWRKSPIGITVLSSHGDWLPLAYSRLLGLRMEPKKGSWLEVEGGAMGVELKWYVPSFKQFYE